MFDIGFWELALIGMLALVVLGPKRLPEAARAAGYWLGRVRNFISNAKSELDHHMQGGDMEEIRRLKQELDETRRYIQQVADETGSELAGSIDPIDTQPANRIGASARKSTAKPGKGKSKAARRKSTGAATRQSTKQAVGKKTARKTVRRKTSSSKGSKPKRPR